MRTKNAEFIIPWQFAIAIREGKASEELRYQIKSLRLLNKYLDGPLKISIHCGILHHIASVQL